MTEDSVLTSMVAHGLGVGILPRLAAAPLPVGATLYALPDPAFREVAVVAWPNARLGDAATAFLHALREHAAGGGSAPGAPDAPDEGARATAR